MTLRIRHRLEAENHIQDAHAWWTKNRTENPSLFIDELNDCLGLLGETPDVGRPYRHRKVPNMRRILLRGSRYHVYYVRTTVAGNDEILILAVWSALRGRAPRIRGM